MLRSLITVKEGQSLGVRCISMSSVPTDQNVKSELPVFILSPLRHVKPFFAEFSFEMPPLLRTNVIRRIYP